MAHSGPVHRRTGAWVLITVLILISILGTLIVPIYARSSPYIGAFPFFYWYQLLWVPFVAVMMAICYLISTRGSRSSADSPGQAAGALHRALKLRRALLNNGH